MAVATQSTKLNLIFLHGSLCADHREVWVEYKRLRDSSPEGQAIDDKIHVRQSDLNCLTEDIRDIYNILISGETLESKMHKLAIIDVSYRLRIDRVLRRLTPSNYHRIKRDYAFNGSEVFQYRWKNPEGKENSKNFPADLKNKVQYSIDRGDSSSIIIGLIESGKRVVEPWVVQWEKELEQKGL